MTSANMKAKEAQAAENLLMKSGKRRDSISSISDSSEEEGARHTWGKKTEYLLAAIGYCVGLGNIWRFPYVCMRNGGGAFLIPFFLSLVVCALPIYFLETALGQFNGQSSWHVWSICPMFKGIGMSMNLLTFYLTWYYSIILAWTLIYLGNSFKSPLPWTRCDEWWNTEACVDANGKETLGANSTLVANGTGLYDGLNNTLVALMQNTDNLTLANDTDGVLAVPSNETVSSADEFWMHNVLERSSGLSDMGGLPWHTTVALIAANIVVLFGVLKGIKSTGKVVYITATLPYLLLTVIIILGVTLPGAGDGIIFYLKPDFSEKTK